MFVASCFHQLQLCTGVRNCLSPARDFRADPHGKDVEGGYSLPLKERLQLATERKITACHGKRGYGLPRKERLRLATKRKVTACHGKRGYGLPRKERLRLATEREVTACHGRTEKHIRGHRPCIVGDPGYLSRYSDSLRDGRSGDRIPVEAKFSFPVQSGPGIHPTLYTLGTGSFQG
jgi:hypothetical protein